MQRKLTAAPLPAWLEALDAEAIASKALPLAAMLTDSLYYPASGLDGIPVKYLGGFVHSFVYADPPMQPHSLDGNLRRLREMESRCSPFGHWSVWERHPARGDAHGPM